MLDNSEFTIENDRLKFKNPEEALLDVYRNDLIEFAEKMVQRITPKGYQTEEALRHMVMWINHYTTYNHWLYKYFMFLQRNSMKARGIGLYFEAIKILKECVLDKI